MLIIRLESCLLLFHLLVLFCRSQSNFENCQEAIVQVTDIELVCNETTCNYGDLANVTVYFEVMDSVVADGGDDMYMKLALYAPGDYVQLYEGNPKLICSRYDAENGGCVNEGSYSFYTVVPLAAINDDDGGYDTSFLPLVQLAFSVEANGGSDLGGVNIGECDVRDDYSDAEEYSTGTNIMASEQRQYLLQLFRVILLVAVAACVSAFVVFKAAVYAQCCNPVEIEGTDNNEYSLMRAKGSFVCPDRHLQEVSSREVV